MKIFQKTECPAVCWVAGFFLLFLLIGCNQSAPESEEETPEEQSISLEQIRQLINAGEFAEAEELAASLAEQETEDRNVALLYAGFSAGSQDRDHEAIEYYLQVPLDSSPVALEAHTLAADLLFFRQGDFVRSEELLLEVLKISPQYAPANEGYGQQLHTLGLRAEAVPYLLNAVVEGRISLNNLVMLGWDQSVVELRETLELCAERYPEHPLPKLGFARIELYHNEQAKALELLQQVVAKDPQMAEAQALLGQQLILEGKNELTQQWLNQLPPAVSTHPEIWFVRGLWADRQNDLKVAVRCFAECLLKTPEHPQANYQMSQLLVKLNRPELAEQFLTRSKQLEQLGQLFTSNYGEPTNLGLKIRAAEQCAQLGRLWESRGWYMLAFTQNQRMADVRLKVEHLNSQLNEAPRQRTIPAHNPALKWDLDEWPLPHEIAPPMNQENEPLSSSPAGTIRFEDVAQTAGIQFTYQNGADPKTAGARMIELDGGGVAVLDFDQDGWPDLYFTQGGTWPVVPDPSTARDRLYRNLGNGRFEDVTEHAGLSETGFSQGVAVGDLDSDGFPDLYIGNIGQNRLYRNNGDGTFQDITAEAGISGSVWTSSCLLADLNGDSFPDLYDVNYLGGDDVFERICNASNGTLQACAPALFPGEPDQFWLNNGEGQFQNRSQACGVDLPDGKGLGIIAADWDHSGKLSLFIANDAVANFLLVNQAPSPGLPKYRDQALAAGVAYNSDGTAQACMGVAFGDLDRDGWQDLFITNFHNESNTFYRQQSPLFFVDETRAADLRDPSYQLLGFGTQCLDADLDGWLDLVLVNGHIDDRTSQGIPYRMPPQFFRNTGGVFEIIPGNQLGEFFTRDQLGRGLARLDFNRDGREDFAVTHLDTPVALLQNQTQTEGHFLALQFRGVETNRDAIGTRITVICEEQTWEYQLAAGDGFQVSNQRQLLIGLGEQAVVKQLKLRWLDGTEQTLENLQVDQEYLLIEGEPRALPIPRE